MVKILVNILLLLICYQIFILYLNLGELHRFSAAINMSVATFDLNIVNADVPVNVILRKTKRANQLTAALNFNCKFAKDVIDLVG